MAYTQIDENTVQDEQGNRYYMQGLGAPASEGPATPESLGATGYVPGLPATAPTPSVLPSDAELPGPRPDNTPQGYNVAAPRNPTPAEARAQGIAGRNDNIVNDLTGFSAAGGEIKSGADLARAAGGVGKAEEQAAEARINSQFDTQALENDKAKAMAKLTAETAQAHEQDVSRLMQQSQSRWTDWKRKNDEAMEAVVDPNRAFHGPAALSGAMYALAFLGAGMQGGQAVASQAQILNKVVEDDISAQKATLENKGFRLNSEQQALTHQDTMMAKGLDDMMQAKNVRLAAIGKQLDAQISEIGLPAAKRAGLLQAKAVIQKEVLTNQEKVQAQYNTDAQRKAGENFQIRKAMLEHSFKLEEQSHEAKLKENANKPDTLPLGNSGLGLQAVDRATGKPVEGNIRLKVKGPEAVKAGQLLTDASEEASMLNQVKTDLSSMSREDILRGGTPAFKQNIMQNVVPRLKHTAGTAVTPEEAARFMQFEFGFDITGNTGLISATGKAWKSTGELTSGVNEAIDNHLRNIATTTETQLRPYLDSDDLKAMDIKFNPQETLVPKVDTSSETLNEAQVRAAGGTGRVVPTEGPRKPVQADTSVAPQDVTKYEEEKAKGRGLAGGLPRLKPDEEQLVKAASDDFSTASMDDVITLSQSYLSRKDLTPEAKHEIRLEAQEALKQNGQRDQAIRDQVENEARYAPGAMGLPVPREKALTPGTAAYDKLLDEAFTRAGLVRKPR